MRIIAILISIFFSISLAFANKCKRYELQVFYKLDQEKNPHFLHNVGAVSEQKMSFFKIVPPQKYLGSKLTVEVIGPIDCLLRCQIEFVKVLKVEPNFDEDYLSPKVLGDAICPWKDLESSAKNNSTGGTS